MSGSLSRFLSLLLLAFCFVGTTGHDQRIESVLHSRWSPTSILSEAAEYISEIDAPSFWPFLEHVFEKQESLPKQEAEADLNYSKFS